jgi:hypothetical protein
VVFTKPETWRVLVKWIRWATVKFTKPKTWRVSVKWTQWLGMPSQLTGS